MIVIGADTHKRSHTLAAVDEATGRALADVTVAAAPRSFGELLRWARGVGGERVWALEDCRHVSGSLERFLLKRGERVVRVPPKLMAGARESTREPGKSDRIDAVAVARAAIREGLESLPVAQLAGAELDIRLLVDHRDRLVKQRTALTNDLRWQLHDLWPELEIPLRALTGQRWPQRLARRLARSEQSARVRIARDELNRVRDLTRAITDLEHELAALVVASWITARRRSPAVDAGATAALEVLVGDVVALPRLRAVAHRPAVPDAIPTFDVGLGLGGVALIATVLIVPLLAAGLSVIAVTVTADFPFVVEQHIDVAINDGSTAPLAAHVRRVGVGVDVAITQPSAVAVVGICLAVSTRKTLGVDELHPR